MSLARDTRGSVFVEALVATLVPIVFFFVTWQLVDLFAAQLILKHAAVAAVRAAIVVGPDDPRFYGGQHPNDFAKGGARFLDVERAAALVIGAAPNLQTAFSVEVRGSYAGNSPITAVVSANYQCHGGWLGYVCGGGGFHRLTAQATMPYQGATYAYIGR